MKNIIFFAGLLLTAGLVVAAAAPAAEKHPGPLMIQEQGSFATGGTIIPAKEQYNPLKPQPAGQTLHGDHANIFYQIPVNARKYPLIFLHGAGQSARTWQTTPDGREGFQNIFLRQGFGVYLVDQPRRGDAGRSTISATVEATPDEQFWFGQFRLGIWPNFYTGSQFAKGDSSLDQFYRQMTPNTGPFDAEVISNALAALFDRVGSAILVTHSQGGGPGWLIAIKSSKVRAVVAYEPGSGFVFPKGELAEPIANASAFGPFKANEVPLEQFMALTRIPIVIYYGDNIPEQPVAEPHRDYWRAALRMARLWAEAVNRHGGDVTVVHLPEVGIHGNTHFPFSDQNNVQIADVLSQWLKDKKVD
ncbi:alpha/beta hydrolase [Desulfovibrio desulfuricans]|uniref:alpha/beta hydrolase n=1 Tax=Desulfovibrio desulfuricans TaxID=876 RepID=UPI001AE5FD83|nr:alpha/beta fold hydrolase [Desulfovibrio desulfuricans]MDD3683588.1 alpha/beta fold hydrolase [Desulfovibrio desulfuricans]QTO39915.1 alpha/beta fold hydrolase [Desulfovibrio desulfuricans]